MLNALLVTLLCTEKWINCSRMDPIPNCVLNRVADLSIYYKKCFNCNEPYIYSVAVYTANRAIEILIKCIECDRIKYYELNECVKK
jgi:hypothetical protein